MRGRFISFLLLFLKVFIYLTFWLWWIFIAVYGLSLVAESRGYSSLGCVGFSFPRLLWLQSTGFSSCSSWALGSWAVLWSVGLVVLQHVGSSWTKDQTGVPCIARWILNHRTTRETSVSLMVENVKLVFIRKCIFPLQLGKRLYPWPTCWRVLL